MSTDPIDTPIQTDAQEIERVTVEDQVEQAYLDYAMSVIVSRALPDVRDGLKPVQRRVLYKMHDMNVTSNSAHRKSSSVIGETMGDLHPHGDKAIYDSLVRMSQDFSLWGPLVDGQGNFGSMDGDPPAAMRYTEARMSALSEELLEDLDKDTVNFKPNYDNRLEEPEVLPSGFPNLLVNGASGIAVGMTTSIPTHNLGEVIDATVHRIKNPECGTVDLMEHMPGPDFPTGANIIGRDGIKQAYETGKGKITVRTEYEVKPDQNQIVITEIPYQKKKSKLVEDIAGYANDQTIQGITDVRDESDRDGVKIVIDIKSTANIDIVENQLIQKALEETFSMNHIALVNDQPKRMPLTELLDHYIDHRREVVQRRSQYLLDEAEDRLHIVNGRMQALDNIENVVETIRNEDSRKDAVAALMESYDFSEEQANHITRMQLSSLTGLKQEELKEERTDLNTEIEELSNILENPDELNQAIIDELNAIKNNHNIDRRTDIVEDYSSVNDEDLIPQEDITVILTENDYIKRMSTDDFRVQNRNGRGVYALNVDDDTIRDVYNINTHDPLFVLTSEGDVHEMKGYEIPEGSRQAHGTNIINLLDINTDEEIECITAVPEEKTDDKYVTIATQNGQVKRTNLSEYTNIWSPGLKTVTVSEGDRIVSAAITGGDSEIILGTRNGQVIRFDESDVRPTGRTSRGVKGIRLSGEDAVVNMAIVDEDTETVLTITNEGVGKQSEESEYNNQHRGGKGVRGIQLTEDRYLVNVDTVSKEDDEIFVCSNNGKVIRVNLDDISTYGRAASGLGIMDLEESDSVVSASIY